MIKKLRRGYELQGLFLNRTIRPFHLAVAIATGVTGYLFLFTHQHDSTWGHEASVVLGSVALTSSIMLFAGWWLRNEVVAEWGLLLAVGIWCTRVVYLLITKETPTLVPWWGSLLLSASWAIGAGGAYLLERYDRFCREEEGR